jgi:hypothetical protein
MAKRRPEPVIQKFLHADFKTNKTNHHENTLKPASGLFVALVVFAAFLIINTGRP